MLRLNDWFEDTTHRVSAFELSDGQRFAWQQVDLLTQAMAGVAPPAPGQVQWRAGDRDTLLAPVLVMPLA